MAGAFTPKRTGDIKGDILGPAPDLYASREAWTPFALSSGPPTITSFWDSYGRG